MPNLNCIEATKQIRKFAPSVKIVVLTMHDSSQVANAAKKAGADRMIQKAAAEEQLIRAVNELMS
jgi:DNA-binding NarL/FixJ family response regulator